MNESLGNLKWLKDRQSGPELERKEGEENINDDTPVRHVGGSRLFHPDARCKTLAKEQQKFHNLGIGYLFKHLPEKDKLIMCMQCDRDRIKPIPRDPYAPRKMPSSKGT